MNILTPTEISGCLTGGPAAVARAIEAAVIKRLAAGVSVEPVGVVIGFDDDTGNAVVDHSCEGPYGPLDDYEGIYNLDQLNTAIAAARVQENERCAKLIEDEEEDGLPLETLANGIRSSLGNSVSFETCYSPTPARREE